MPFKSEQQKKWMFANKPAMAREWMKDTGKVQGKNNYQKKVDKAARSKGF